eukprot:2491170-Alexandrium_andersonii.AAC.1
MPLHMHKPTSTEAAVPFDCGHRCKSAQFANAGGQPNRDHRPSTIARNGNKVRAQSTHSQCAR